MGVSHNPVIDRGTTTGSFDLTDHPMPSGREEAWRFTPLGRLRSVLDERPAEGHLEWSTSALPDGVELVELSSADARARTVEPPVDRAAALAVALSGGATLLRIPDRLVVTEPITIRLHGTGQDVRGHLLVEAGVESVASVVLERTGSATYSELVSVRVGDQAALDIAFLQLWDDDAVHAGHIAALVGRDARLRTFTVTFGGESVRLIQTVGYAGPGGSADLFGLYFADAGQHFEHRSFIDHTEPNCRSNAMFKGALQGAGARTVWVGDVLIRPEATGTSTYEVNRNLILSDGARADSIPNLEIETGEIVGAGHASATGRFDDEQMFYLRARGIPEDEARRLVVRGFFAAVIHEIGVASVEQTLNDAIERELEKNMAVIAGSAS